MSQQSGTAWAGFIVPQQTVECHSNGVVGRLITISVMLLWTEVTHSRGTVHKGMLEDGMIVAVKKSKVFEEENLEEFINEIIILSPINHGNVVKILGCCLETEVPMLVYDFIPNKSPFDHLQNPSEDSPTT